MNINILNEALDQLCSSLGYYSEGDFSINWLGRGKTFMWNMRQNYRIPNVKVLENLESNIQDYINQHCLDENTTKELVNLRNRVTYAKNDRIALGKTTLTLKDFIEKEDTMATHLEITTTASLEDITKIINKLTSIDSATNVIIKYEPSHTENGMLTKIQELRQRKIPTPPNPPKSPRKNIGYFTDLKLEHGDILSFDEDPSIKVSVISENTVNDNGVEKSLSVVTKKYITNGNKSGSYRGINYWRTSTGELLYDRAVRLGVINEK